MTGFPIDVPATAGDPQASLLDRVCTLALTRLPVDALAISLIADRTVWSTLRASDDRAAAAEELGFTLGESPALEAFTSYGPVLVPDLDDAADAGRWPQYAPAVLAIGFRSVLAFPLQAGPARIGTFTCFAQEPVHLAGASLTVALTLADDVFLVALGAFRPGGADGDRPGADGAGGDGADLDTGPFLEAEIYQASGMIMDQLGVGPAEAMVRLRARAYATGRPLRLLAHDIVTRRLRFDDDAGPSDPRPGSGRSDHGKDGQP